MYNLIESFKWLTILLNLYTGYVNINYRFRESILKVKTNKKVDIQKFRLRLINSIFKNRKEKFISRPLT